MSKKTRKQKQKKFPLMLVLFGIGGLLLIAGVVFFAGWGGNDEAGSGTPVLAVDQDVIDYGDVKLSIPKTFAITVTNTGDGMLRFKEKPYIQVLEGC